MATINSKFCYNTQSTYSVNFNGNTPAIGESWLANYPEKETKRCFEITSLTDEPSAFFDLETQYTDCVDCLSNNYGYFVFENCIRGGERPRPIFITASSLGLIPNKGDVFYLNFEYRGDQYFTCASWEGNYSEGDSISYNEILSVDAFSTLLSPPVLQTDCQTCLNENSATYRVERCTDDTVDFVPLLSGYLGHIISYTDGISQYCGRVIALEAGSSLFTFISDYGLCESEQECELLCQTCLDIANDKILLQSCTDSEVTEVVWASSLFEAGDISNLSTDSGCFEIVGLTEDDVTINSYLNFDPQPGCEPCIECNGINYSYTTCSGEGNGDFKSYQYLSAGTKFFHSAINECCEVIGTSSSYYNTLYSVETFADCPDCQNNSDINYWIASACTNSSTYSSFYVTTDSTAQVGDTVKLMWGSNEWICATITNTTSSYSGYYTYYNTLKESGVTKKYNSCTDCNSQGLIGVTLVNCDTNVESFVSITLDNYLSIYNFGSLSNYSVKGQDGQCYQILNLCPIPLQNNFTPVEFYLNCFFCEPANPPRSANTEVTFCEEICGDPTNTVIQVNPPHPVWTDGYGTQVTQLNMVTLGGMFGLNN
jgi:hypothetical protein